MPPEKRLVVREFTPCAYVEAGFDRDAVIGALRALTEERSPTTAITPIAPDPVAGESDDPEVGPAQ